MKELFLDETIYEINDSLTSEITDTRNIKAYILAVDTDLRSENKQKLIEILNAINLKLDDNALIIPLKPNQSYSIGSVGNTKSKPLIISFGIPSSLLDLQSLSADYFILRFENLNLVMADTLDQLIQDKVLKGKLWNAIKGFKSTN